ncbi:MAG: heavy metal-responsive transcriptional regulator [Bryobacteraceae bacterium]
MAPAALRIGDLSRRTGLTIDTIRFYDKRRLVPSARRSEGGFRLFREDDIEVLGFIRSAQELGFSLEEIRELLSLRQDAIKACPKVQGLLSGKLVSVRTKIAALTSLESELESVLRKCNKALGSKAKPCPVLAGISLKRP